MKTRFLLLLLCIPFLSSAQDYYYPPINSFEEWETIDPSEVGWCAERVDSLLAFAESRNTRGFIILKDGRIVVEQYFNGFHQDSIWYWASAGKSLVSFLVGQAGDQGYLNMEDPTSDYLGQGWTSMDTALENQITIRHQLSMSTGLDDDPDLNPPVIDPLNCMEPRCLTYLTDPDQRWYYHNAPYRLLQDVVANASGKTFNGFTNEQLEQRIGSNGFWFNRIYWSRTRDLARFGSLILRRGVWDQDTLLHDQDYFNQMIQPSQTDNPSYGYLWWLNGQDGYKLPTVEIQFPGWLVPTAPADAFFALGKNDQKLYVVPSLNMVVVRFGDAADDVRFSLTEFDRSMWTYLNALDCETVSTNEPANSDFQIVPNPSGSEQRLLFSTPDERLLHIYNLQGQLVFQHQGNDPIAILPDGLLPAGTYVVQVSDAAGQMLSIKKLIRL